MSTPLFVTISHVSCHVSSSHDDVVISTFYDARELQAGQDFQSRFEPRFTAGPCLLRCGVEPDPLRQWQIARVIDRVGTAAHIRLP